MNRENREEFIDIARGIGLILVLMGHKGVLKEIVYTFHIPLFFFISGYVFSTKSTFKKFIVNKVEKLIIPYFSLGMLIVLFNSGVYYILKYIPGKNYYSHMIKFLNFEYGLKSLIFQNRWTPLWFLTCLFILEIMFFFIVKNIKEIKTIFFISLFLYFLGTIYYYCGGKSLYWNVDVIFSASIFFGGGYCLKKYFGEKVSSKNKVVELKWIFLFFIINLTVGNLNRFIFKSNLEMFSNEYHFFIFTIIAAFSGIFMVILISKRLKNSYLRYIGQNTLLIYGIHGNIIYPIFNFIFKNYKELIIVKIITIILTLFIGFIFTKLLLKSKFKFILGL